MSSGRQAARAAAGEQSQRSPDEHELAGALAVLDIHRRDKLLEAVAITARELLNSSDLDVSLPKVAERIGVATGVDRVHIFLVDPATGRGDILQHFVWIVPGLETPLAFRHASESMASVGLKSWVTRLGRGETIVGHVRDFDPETRGFFAAAGVKAVVSVPVFAEGKWLGLIGFDDCHGERDWSAADIDALKTVAELVGAAVARASHLKTMADANRIVEKSPTILYRLSPEPPFQLTYVSQNVSRYGYAAEDLLAKPSRWLDMVAPDDLAGLMDKINLLVEGKTDRIRIDFHMKKADGTLVCFEGEGYALRDRTGKLTGIEGILTDMTDRKQAAQKIATLARTDSLTGLPNRAAFLERLGLEFARARRSGTQFAVLYLDLDHFKDINDTLGHPTGDKLLCVVGERLKDCVRETDMVARFGGDEFAVLQVDISDNSAIEALASKIGEVVAKPYTIGGNEVSTSVSIGVVPYRGDIAGTDAMMMKADLALYRAKNEGRNQYRFHVAALDDETRERMVIAEDLRHAVERHEFELYYQPQVDLETGAIVGFEALIRWNHPTRGLMLPAAFIPIAETSGSILKIGEWVVAQACQQITVWNKRGVAPPILAVNLSGAQFKLASQLDKIVLSNLDCCHIPPGQLELELTESVLIETAQRHSDAFLRLKQVGVRLAIDDFGTGYSSLDYLRSFRVSRLKIDRRFVNDVTSNADDAAIVRATIGLAHALGIEVLAEGVETAAQRDFLLAAGCKLAQGFYFGQPMPAKAATALLSGKRQLAAG